MQPCQPYFAAAGGSDLRAATALVGRQEQLGMTSPELQVLPGQQTASCVLAQVDSIAQKRREQLDGVSRILPHPNLRHLSSTRYRANGAFDLEVIRARDSIEFDENLDIQKRGAGGCV